MVSKRMVLGAALVAFGLLVGAPLFGQYAPPPGGEDVLDLYSPRFLSGLGTAVSTESPHSDALNPAVAGGGQRTILDLNYLMLASLVPGSEAVGGHAINLGLTVPTPGGVLTGSIHFLNSALPGMNLGNRLGVNFSFAKDLFPDLLVGAGLQATFGSIDRFDVGVGLDLGFVHIPATPAGLDRFRWGASISGIGKGYDPTIDPAVTSFPGPFSPAVAMSFSPITEGDVRLDVTAGARFPSFQNARVNLGADLTLFDFFTLTLGWGVDLRELLVVGVPQRSLLPRVGLSFNFQTQFAESEDFISSQGWNRSEVRTRVAVAPLYNQSWAFGAGINAPLGILDETPPSISVIYPELVHMSPNNDGVSDSVSFGLEIEDERFVVSYRGLITDADGSIIREFRNVDERPENQGFQNIIDRLLAVDSGTPIPEEIRWDGTREDGSIAPDGRYAFTIQATDDNGNRAVSPAYQVELDNTPPSVTLGDLDEEERVFSPNGDGNKDTIRIEQSGSAEDLWTGRIRDAAGRVVSERQWRDGPPSSFEWNGRDAAGSLVPDGVYSYEISAVDAAGNAARESLANIIVNTEPTPVSLAIDLAAFSPNADGTRDTLTMTPEIPVTEGVESWTIRIIGPDGRTRRTISDTRIPRETVSFDGRDDLGTPLPEGSYRAELAVRYRAGNEPTATSPAFVIDVTPPSAMIRSDFEVFSPNGDGNRDSITFFQETSAEEGWTGVLTSEGGAEIRRYTWFGPAELQARWDGRTGEGLIADDGTYFYQLRTIDRAGNLGASNPVSFELNTEETPVVLSAQYEAFSPNADNSQDRIGIFPQFRVTEGLASFQLEILNQQGETVRRITDRDAAIGGFYWDGIDGSGRRVSDGAYRARVSVAYENGNQAASTTPVFRVDTVYPRASVTPSDVIFSPNGDGNKDSVTLVQETSDEELWRGTVVDTSGAVVREFYFQGEAPDLRWNGTDDAGNVLADGAYRYVLESTDAAGNRAIVESVPVELDTRRTSVFVTVDAVGFSPNGDGFRDDIGFTLYLGLADGMESWELSIIHADGSVARRFTGTEAFSRHEVRWDGRAPSGRLREGSYTAVFGAVYRKGDRPEARTTTFALDVTAPEARVGLEPLPFSPDNDGLNDELVISLSVSDMTGIGPWRLEILGREDRLFREFSGRGRPADEIRWDGRAANGELVESARDYPYVLTIADELGNIAEYTGTIPVDVLVVRDGDRLRVQITNITFAPDSSDLVLDPDDPQGRKNLEVLNRLAEVFARYSTYNVRIEGHAVAILGTQREQDETLVPLSRARAESVRQELIERGLAPGRLSVAGIGGSEPLVPHSDLENRWRNRRVEFILIR